MREEKEKVVFLAMHCVEKKREFREIALEDVCEGREEEEARLEVEEENFSVRWRFLSRNREVLA